MKNIEDYCADNFLDLETTFLTLNVRPFYLPIDVFHVLKCQSDTRHCTNQPNTCPTHLLSHPKFDPTYKCYKIKDVRLLTDILTSKTSVSAVFINLNFYFFVQLHKSVEATFPFSINSPSERERNRLPRGVVSNLSSVRPNIALGRHKNAPCRTCKLLKLVVSLYGYLIVRNFIGRNFRHQTRKFVTFARRKNLRNDSKFL